MQAPELPTWQDCHELWCKKRRRQIRDQDAGAVNAQAGGKAAAPKDKAKGFDEGLDQGG